MFRLICMAIGYCIGCVQTAYIVGKIVGKIDIREHGSGNAGTTNTARVLGLNAGLTVFISDVLKAVIAFLVCALIYKGSFFLHVGESGLYPGFYGGLGVILGHNYPFYLKFKGGKGIASSIGIIMCLDLRIAAISYVCGFIVVVLTRYVSAASMTILTLSAVLLWVFQFPYEINFLGTILAVLAIYQHRENIKRLINGNENKFSLAKKNRP